MQYRAGQRRAVFSSALSCLLDMIALKPLWCDKQHASESIFSASPTFLCLKKKPNHNHFSLLDVGSGKWTGAVTNCCLFASETLNPLTPRALSNAWTVSGTCESPVAPSSRHWRGAYVQKTVGVSFRSGTLGTDRLLSSFRVAE